MSTKENKTKKNKTKTKTKKTNNNNNNIKNINNNNFHVTSLWCRIRQGGMKRNKMAFFFFFFFYKKNSRNIRFSFGCENNFSVKYYVWNPKAKLNTKRKAKATHLYKRRGKTSRRGCDNTYSWIRVKLNTHTFLNFRRFFLQPSFGSATGAFPMCLIKQKTKV